MWHCGHLFFIPSSPPFFCLFFVCIFLWFFLLHSLCSFLSCRCPFIQAAKSQPFAQFQEDMRPLVEVLQEMNVDELGLAQACPREAARQNRKAPMTRTNICQQPIRPKVPHAHQRLESRETCCGVATKKTTRGSGRSV